MPNFFSKDQTTHRIADSFINYGILARQERLKWTRTYLDKHRFRIGRFHEKVLTEIEEILGTKHGLFWQMATPQVLLLREYYNLKELLRWNSEELVEENRNVEKTRRSKKVGDQWDRYTKICNSSYSETLVTVTTFAEAIIEKFIIPRWKGLGFSLSELDRHVPERDAFITGGRWGL